MIDYTKAPFARERGIKSKKPMDRLTQDVLAAERAGETYGQYKAKHPHTAVVEEIPAPQQPGPGMRSNVCAHCGKQFFTRAEIHMKKYCSDECTKAAAKARYIERKKQSEQLKPCPICGTMVGYEKGRVYCSEACKQKAKRERIKAKYPHRYEPRQCPECGKMFTSNHGRAYCSETCQAKASNERARERYKQKRR